MTLFLYGMGGLKLQVSAIGLILGNVFTMFLFTVALPALCYKGDCERGREGVVKRRDGVWPALQALVLVACIWGASYQVRAQDGGAEAQTVKQPAYDVMSIKPNKSGSGSVSVDWNSDSYRATNVSLKVLLQSAYGIREDLISGVTGPIESARFDVSTKIVEPDPVVMKQLNDKQRRALLLPALIERFQLKTHMETKILPVYELVVVQGGPKFKQVAGTGKGGGMSIRNTEVTATALSMKPFVSALEGHVNRTVIDKTGLEGGYDFQLKWSRDDGTASEAADAGPSIFTALQEQLGLKLVSSKGPVETLVIDHVEMPSED